MIKASLLIVTRNRAKLLKFSLQSIIGRYADTEVVLLDDSSVDNTKEIATSYAENIRYHKLSRQNGYLKNPGSIFNIGHKLCKGDVILEQGGEVCHLTDCVTPLLEICEPGIVAIARVYNGEPHEMEALKKSIAEGKYEFPADYTPSSIETNGNNLPVPRVGPEQVELYSGWERPAPFLFLGAIHARDFEMVGCYDENIELNGDGDLAQRLWDAGVRFVFSGKAVAFHQKHGKA